MVKHAIQHELPLPWMAKQFANDPTPFEIFRSARRNYNGCTRIDTVTQLRIWSLSRAEVISYHRGGAKLYQQSRSKSVTGFENSRTLKFKVSGFGALPTGIWVSRN